jgi:hypothetical protein
MSYLLSLGFEELVRSRRIEQELANAIHPDFDHLMKTVDSLPDDDES